MIRTPLCDLLDIEHPIVQGGMAWIATAELVSAVSEAGGLGILGGGTAPADYLRDQIRLAREMTSKPFGVNLALFAPNVADLAQICLDEKVRVVATGGGNPAPYVPSFKEAGMIVISVVASVALAKRVERMGADALVAEGMESGGHIGDVSTFPLVPQVVDAVSVPVVAAGGIADGRGLAAALALGAAGVQMGTRFICVDECTAHDNYKQTILNAGDRSTITTGQSLGHPVRAIRNPMSRQFGELEREGLSPEQILEFGVGKLRLAFQEGDMVDGSVMAGQSAGLVREVKSTQDLIHALIAEAEDVISGLSGLVV